jgi:hypothetical protein
MTLKTLFDKGRRTDIHKAIGRGGPLPFQHMKGSEPPACTQADGANVSEIGRFLDDERKSTDPAKQRLGRADAFIREKTKELVTTHGVDEFKHAENLARQKQQQAQNGANVAYTPLEGKILELCELAEFITWLTKQAKTEDVIDALIRAGGKVGP